MMCFSTASPAPSARTVLFVILCQLVACGEEGARSAASLREGGAVTGDSSCEASTVEGCAGRDGDEDGGQALSPEDGGDVESSSGGSSRRDASVERDASAVSPPTVGDEQDDAAARDLGAVPGQVGPGGEVPDEMTGAGGSPPVDGSIGAGAALSAGGTPASVAIGRDLLGGVPGLMQRPQNPSCLAPERQAFVGPVVWVPAQSGLAGLTMMRQLPDGSWIEIYRDGRVFAVDSDFRRAEQPMLSIAGVSSEVVELGMFGLAIHPQWPARPYIFLYYMTGGSWTVEGPNTHVHIDRYTVTGDGLAMSIDPGSREVLLDFDRGAPWGNHAGGTLEFDPLAPTPTLYAAMGDGENRPEVQNVNSLYGKLLRFEVDVAPYTAQVVGVGLRNPFRFSFDSLNGDLWIADVGDGAWEEVNRVSASQVAQAASQPLNFGWPLMEGPACLNGGDPGAFCGEAPPALPLLAPVHAYDRSVGISVIGGRVYRGANIAGLAGTYIFSDYFPQNGEASWRLLPNSAEDPLDPGDDYVREASNGQGFIAYVEDNQRELLAISYDSGEIFRLEAGGGGDQPIDSMAARLSGTGCFAQDGTAATGLVAYDLNAPLWSDGASKRRWLALPDGTAATLRPDGDLEFPAGTVLAKEFTLDDVRVETRLFVRHPDGVWAGYSYAWLDELGELQSEATLLPDEAITRAVSGTGKNWTYPSRTQCLTCHTEAAGASLGLEVGQLNRLFDYPTGQRANQLLTLHRLEMIAGDLAPFQGLAFPEYDDPDASLHDRAWAYLHANCAGCHRPGALGAQGRSNLVDLRFDLFSEGAQAQPLRERLCGLAAGAGDLGLGAGAAILQPGNPGDWANLGQGGSVLYLRMSARASVPGSTGTMPQLGTAEPDTQTGLPLVREWITEATCPL